MNRAARKRAIANVRYRVGREQGEQIPRDVRRLLRDTAPGGLWCAEAPTDPEAACMASELRANVEAALQHLPERKRLATILRFNLDDDGDDRTFAEVGKALPRYKNKRHETPGKGVHAQRVRQIIEEAGNKLRRLLIAFDAYYINPSYRPTAQHPRSRQPWSQRYSTTWGMTDDERWLWAQGATHRLPGVVVHQLVSVGSAVAVCGAVNPVISPGALVTCKACDPAATEWPTDSLRGLRFFDWGGACAAPPVHSEGKENTNMKKICSTTRTKVHQAKTLDASRFTPDAGAGTALGEVIDYGETRTAILLVGLEKGKHPVNNEGACARKPGKFSVGEADRAFETGRLMQVGEKNVAATRRTGRGWFEGRPEKSVAYEIVFIPSDAEPTYPDFIANVNKLAEAVGGGLCQDSVLVVHDDSDKRHTVAALRDPEKK